MQKTRYIISYDDEIPEYPHILYKSFEIADKKRLQLSKTEGTIFKVTIETKKEFKKDRQRFNIFNPKTWRNYGKK